MDTEELQPLIDRRNRFVLQCRGLQARVDKLESRIAALDDEIQRMVDNH